MIISDSSWAEAGAFLEKIGYRGSITENRAFREDSYRFLSLLLAKNEEVNLTGAKDLETAFWKHLIDSLAVLALEELGTMVDWGCGGGFPGIPVALARRHSEDPTPVLFVDSVGKKVRAVEEFCSALNLDKTQGLVGRGEDLIRAGKLRSVKSVVMRAVAPAERAVKWIDSSIPDWIFFLGPQQRSEWQNELPRLAKRKIELKEELLFSLPHGLGDRCLIRLSKRST